MQARLSGRGRSTRSASARHSDRAGDIKSFKEGPQECGSLAHNFPGNGRFTIRNATFIHGNVPSRSIDGVGFMRDGRC
jgi:hypothetical protein